MGWHFQNGKVCDVELPPMLPHGTDGDCLSGSIQEKNTPNLSTDGLVLQRFHPGSADSTVRLALQPVYGLFCIWAVWLKQVTSPLCVLVTTSLKEEVMVIKPRAQACTEA